MNQIENFKTVGREHHPGFEVNLYCSQDENSLEYTCLKDRYRVVYIKEGHGVLRNGGNSQIVTSPMVLCLNEKDNVELQDTVNLKLDIMYFDPICFELYKSYENLQAWKDSLQIDDYFFRPFFDRTNTYIGALATNHYIGNRISKLIALTNLVLTEQKDCFWPCRSRSYFIELLILVNSLYEEDIVREPVFSGVMTKEISQVVTWLHAHYMDKIVMEDVTRAFNTNKTTLNKKFKEVMGITVMEYVQNFKLQIACSLLRKTYLSVNEIMMRAGYRDDAHFLRSFKKYAGCTPTEYRNSFEEG